jgi:hypothetical protein
LAGQIVRLSDQRFNGRAPFRGALGKDARHRPRLGKLFRERLAVAAG